MEEEFSGDACRGLSGDLVRHLERPRLLQLGAVEISRPNHVRGNPISRSLDAGGPGIQLDRLPGDEYASARLALYSAAKLLGLEFHEAGVSFKPDLPMKDYEFTSPLLGFKKSAESYSGWYAPAVAGRWDIELKLSSSEAARMG